VAIANGDTGTLQLLDAQTLQTRWTTRVGGDADNVRYDAAAKRLFVAAEGGIFVLNPANGTVAKHIAIDGPGPAARITRWRLTSVRSGCSLVADDRRSWRSSIWNAALPSP
jgi:hypothetical protein